MTADEVVKHLSSFAVPANIAGMERFGITAAKKFGIPTPVVKQYAREVKREAADRHALAQELWATGIYDARAIAFMIDDPKKVTTEQMEAWAADFDNWATVDGTCCYLFCRTPLAYEKVFEWAGRDQEFIKRAAFSLIAYLTVHDKRVDDDTLAAFLPLIERHSDDGRNFVKKAVNWSLRQIGKHNRHLNKLAIDAAERIRARGSRSAKWIASDALRELLSEKVAHRLNKQTENSQ